MDKIKAIIKSSPFVIAFIYIIIGFIWIQFSDQLVLSLFDEPESITQAQSMKGWFFVSASGILIFLLVMKSNNMLGDVISDLQRSRDKFAATFEHAPVGIVHHRPNENWIEVNQTLCRMLGYEKDELLQLKFNDFIHSDDLEKGRELDKDLIDGKMDRFETEKRYRKKDGTYFHGLLTKSAVYNGTDEPAYIVGIIQNISLRKKAENQIKQSLKEKEIMLSEIHHRVKNNLALISALFELQNMYTDDENVHAILNNSKLRIKCLSLIHETFSKSGRTANINFSHCLSSLVDIIQRKIMSEISDVHIVKEISQTTLNINQAIPLGLICNELLMNTNPASFDNVEKPSIEISLEDSSDQVTLEISDNGNNGVHKEKLTNTDTISHTIITTLVSQLKGDFKVPDTKSQNTFMLTFRKRNIKGPGSNLNGE
jgi:PAS domain S-box-containing protein